MRRSGSLTERERERERRQNGREKKKIEGHVFPKTEGHDGDGDGAPSARTAVENRRRARVTRGQEGPRHHWGERGRDAPKRFARSSHVAHRPRGPRASGSGRSEPRPPFRRKINSGSGRAPRPSSRLEPGLRYFTRSFLVTLPEVLRRGSERVNRGGRGARPGTGSVGPRGRHPTRPGQTVSPYVTVVLRERDETQKIGKVAGEEAFSGNESTENRAKEETRSKDERQGRPRWREGHRGEKRVSGHDAVDTACSQENDDIIVVP